jgi:predicted small integral membrane protein
MKNTKYKALVMVDDVTNSVIVMFNGFEDYEDAWSFSQHITEELQLDKIPLDKRMTVH